MSRLRQPLRGQTRLLPLSQLSAPDVEQDIVLEIQTILRKLSVPCKSGRIPIFDQTGYNGIKFAPIFGPGTPDLIIFPVRNALHGIEVKRSSSEYPRQSQILWAEQWGLIGTKVLLTSDAREVVPFIDELRALHRAGLVR